MAVPTPDPVPSNVRTSGRRARTIVFVAVAALALGAGLLLILRPWRHVIDGHANVPPDPRLEYAGPFQNIKPTVAYVSDDRCADCHADLARSYAEHSMGRSLRAAAAEPQTLAATPASSAFQALGSTFHIVRTGATVLHQRQRLAQDGTPAASLDWEVHYAVGSGMHGHSYFAERDGYLFQTPISWYSQKRIWDLSPGFAEAQLTGRPVLPECLFCHANHADYREGSMNHYATPVLDGRPIGCQRCHGPGERHVAARDKGDAVLSQADETIVNPGRLEWSLREAVCEQCHLEGEIRVLRRGRGLFDYRPGLPLEQFWAVLFPTGESGEGARAVGHVEQMYRSRCFQQSDDKNHLGCISCHDPHKAVAAKERVNYYRSRCLQCHEQRGCSLPVAERLRQSAQDSCIQCHMPPYGASDIPHTASTDHRILRDPKRESAHSRKPSGTALPPDGFPLSSFYRDRPALPREEDERDIAVGMVRQAAAGDTGCLREIWRALPILEAAHHRDPDDLPAAEAYGQALALRDHPAKALAVFESILARAPERERVLFGAAAMAETLGKFDAALGYWRRAVAANPLSPDYRRRFATLLAKKESWAEARAECDAWIRLDPFSVDARSTRIVCLLGLAEKDHARQEFDRIERLAPKNLAELKARLSDKLK